MRKTASTNYENRQQLEEFCDAAYTLHCIGGRWKLSLLVQLLDKPLRFSELKQALPLITERVLSLQLKELEVAGLIDKQPGNTAGVYSLSARGQSLSPVIQSLSTWGKVHKPVPVKA